MSRQFALTTSQPLSSKIPISERQSDRPSSSQSDHVSYKYVLDFYSGLLTDFHRQRFSGLSTLSDEHAAGSDSASIYEDCVCDASCSHTHLVELGGLLLQRLNSPDTRLPFLCEAFDAPAYGHHCLAKYLERQREETMGPQKLVFEHPSLLPWPSRSLPSTDSCGASSSTAAHPPQTATIPPPHHRLQRLQQCIVDEFENAVAVLCIGFIIYTCLFLFFLYNTFTRGLLRSH